VTASPTKKRACAATIPGVRVIVFHAGYGCDTGCCGHVVELDDGRSAFGLGDHPYGDDPRAFAEELVRDHFGEEHVADLAWDDCVIVDD
jgi:hypothetical protein